MSSFFFRQLGPEPKTETEPKYNFDEPQQKTKQKKMTLSSVYYFDNQ